MPLLWTKRKRPAGRGEIYAPVYARGSLRGSLSPFCLCVFLSGKFYCEWTTKCNDVTQSLTVSTKHEAWQSRIEKVRRSKRGNDRNDRNEGNGMFISSDLMARVSLCMSHTSAEYPCTHTHTRAHTCAHTYTVSVSACGWFTVQHQCIFSS